MEEWLSGGCHCGAVAFEVLVCSGPICVQDCNCTICTKKGFLHLIVPSKSFRLLAPASTDELGLYTFGTGVAKHLFCKRCGICSFYVPRSNPDGYSVNARCLNDYCSLIKAQRIQVEAFDGRDNWNESASSIAHLSK